MELDIFRILDSGKVRRWHTNPQLSTTLQSDADHTWGVIAIAEYLCKDLVDLNFMRFALYHDCGEIAIGDISSVVKMRRTDLSILIKECENKEIKRMGIEMPKITPEQKRLMKLSDILEASYHILKYAPCPNEVEGLEASLSMISSLIFDFGPKADDIYQKIDFKFNALIAQRGLRNKFDEIISITPF